MELKRADIKHLPLGIYSSYVFMVNN